MKLLQELMNDTQQSMTPTMSKTQAAPNTSQTTIQYFVTYVDNGKEKTAVLQLAPGADPKSVFRQKYGSKPISNVEQGRPQRGQAVTQPA